MLNDEVMNAEEAAKVLHIGRNAVYQLAKSGELPSYKVGRKILFTYKDLQTYIETKHITSAKASTEARAPHYVRSETPRGPSSQEDAVVIAGHGVSVSLLVDRLQTFGTPARHSPTNSYDGLVDLYNGRVQGALIHLYDQRTNSYNIPYVQRLLPGTSVIVFRIVKRGQGFVVARGNPKSISSWGALLRAGIRLANRHRGCGSRILMDEKLLAMGADTTVIAGYDTCYDNGLAAAEAVSRGLADVAIAGEQVAAQIDGIDFIRMQNEWLDLVISKEGRGRELALAVKSFFADNAFRREYGRIVLGDDELLGTIVYEC